MDGGVMELKVPTRSVPTHMLAKIVREIKYSRDNTPVEKISRLMKEENRRNVADRSSIK